MAFAKPYDSKDGRRWEARWGEPGPDGTRRVRTRRGFLTRGEAEAYASAARTGKVPSGGGVSLDDVTSSWQATKRGRLQPTTVSRYASMLERHVLPQLGDWPIDRITRAELQTRLDELGMLLAPATVNAVRGVLLQVFEHAKTLGARRDNPIDGVPAPRQVRTVRRTWSSDQLGTFADFVAGDDWDPLWTTLGTTGIRAVEGLDLGWSDVDLAKATANVAGRTIGLDLITVLALRQQRDRQAEARKATGASWTVRGRIFTRPDGSPLSRDAVSRRFRELNAAAGLPSIGLHGLRVTYAQVAFLAGIPLPIIANRLGHQRPHSTLDMLMPALPTDWKATGPTPADLFARSRT